ncbi:acyl-CoA dehydrogenase [Streptomyces sp. NPDC005573]|uniref:acyl-CoA dehydrogenase n=1 Tax=Streptomyces sp. NPDC005573 TaxID=3156890 RepID=UPI00339EDFFC
MAVSAGSGQRRGAATSEAEAEDGVLPGRFWQRVAHEFGDDLAVDAPDRDRAGKPPYDEVARLRESGLHAVLAPPGAAGTGTGTEWESACAIVRRVAAADGSMGELLGRHYVLSWSPRFFADPGHAAEVESRAVREQWLWAGDVRLPDPGQAPAEPVRPGGGGVSPVLTPAAGGYLLTGHLTLATAVNVADRFVLDAVCAATGETLVVLVDPSRPGITRAPSPERLGQRLADAGTLLFDEVSVPAGQVLGPAVHDEYGSAPYATVAPLALRLMLAHVALGIAEGALAEARDLRLAETHTRWAAHGSGGRLPVPVPAADADQLLAFGELALASCAAAAVVDRATAAMGRALRAGRELDAGPRADAAALVAAAEAATFRTALLTGERVLELAESEGLDRFWRNARALTGRVLAAPGLRAIGDHFLNDTRAGRWQDPE